MLTLNDGRIELWQWDTGRKLTVDADCSQVHFSNKVFGRSIDVDVVDGVASIPDILLYTDKELTAWAFVGTAENGYTKISKVFKVNKRNKPADYVFTPPEQTTLGEIMERLDLIEETQDPDAIKNAVDDYLASNPIQVEETDPTVPDWAKQPTKPKYTAAEVGAIPDTTEIPVVPTNVSAFENDAGYLTEHQDLSGYAKTEDIPDKLPNPQPLTFTGAVEATYDGSKPVEVVIPSGGATDEQIASAVEAYMEEHPGATSITFDYLTEEVVTSEYKNLFDMNTMVTANQGITGAGVIGSYNWGLARVPVKENTIYSIKMADDNYDAAKHAYYGGAAAGAFGFADSTGNTLIGRLSLGSATEVESGRNGINAYYGDYCTYVSTVSGNVISYVTFTTPEGCAYLLFNTTLKANAGKIQLEEGDTIHNYYMPYDGGES